MEILIIYMKDADSSLAEVQNMVNEQGNDFIDRRLVIKFTTLNEKQEIALINELISFIYYYYLQTGTSKVPDSVKVLKYYNTNIKKPSSIQRLLDGFYVQVDAITYIKEIYDKVILILHGMEDDRQKAIIDITKDYDRKHYLEAMRYWLDKYKENKGVKDIIDYLNTHSITDANITDDYIKRIINKVFYLV